MSAEPSELPERPEAKRDKFTYRRSRAGAEGAAGDSESAMRARWAREKEDANRASIGNLRYEAGMLRQELRGDIEKVSDASRERDRELHQKFDQRNEKFDTRLDQLREDVTALRAEVETFNKLAEKHERGEFDDVPFYARPSYIKAMGLAIAAVLGALIVSLGMVFGWGHSSAKTPHGAHASAEAPPTVSGDAAEGD